MKEGKEDGKRGTEIVLGMSYFHATNPSLSLIEAFVLGSLQMGTSVIRYVP